MDEINWATLSPQSSGQTDRHHRAAPTPLAVWKCPSCNAENHGELKFGCSACGSGRPGYKAEVKPLPPVDRPVILDPLAAAFADWVADHQVDPVDRALCFEAWKAGMAYARSAHPIPQPVPMADLPLPGTPESRTLAAALTYFLDHVLSESPEECTDGTWITPEQAKALIQQLEGS
jgi:hypothetical protein